MSTSILRLLFAMEEVVRAIRMPSQLARRSGLAIVVLALGFPCVATAYNFKALMDYGNGATGPGLQVESANELCHMIQPQDTDSLRWFYIGPSFELDPFRSYTSTTTFCEYDREFLTMIGGEWVWTDQPTARIGIHLLVQCEQTGQWIVPPVLGSVCPQYFVLADPPVQAECGQSCNSVGDPVNPATGGVYVAEKDIASNGELEFHRYYNSKSSDSDGVDTGWRQSFSRSIRQKYSSVAYGAYRPANPAYSSLYANAASACASGFAQIRDRISTWHSATTNYVDGVCTLSQGTTAIGTLPIMFGSRQLPAPGPAVIGFDAIRDDGKMITFWLEGGNLVAPPGISLRLQQTANGFTLRDTRDSVEAYDTNGKLLSVTSRGGVVRSMGYDTAGRLSTVVDTFGHQLTLTYDGQGRLATATRE